MQVVEMILSLNFTPNVLSHVDLQYFMGGGGSFHPKGVISPLVFNDHGSFSPSVCIMTGSFYPRVE